jgi:NADH-quinone oxidoreductase subunit J
MSALLFYAFSFFTLLTALLTVLNKNAVASALSLLLCLCGIAGLFVLLDAFLLAVLLVLVYAGAVVALFLFIIMLLDMQGGERKAFSKIQIAAYTGLGALFFTGLLAFLRLGHVDSPSLAEIAPVGAGLRAYADQLFTVYLLPVQIVGFLLLISMLGVIVLSKRFEGLDDIK